MSKPVKNIRDIFEATDQPHSTKGYRKTLVDHWIAHQENEPASLHEPTILESNAPNATQRSRPPSSKSLYKNVNEEQRIKKRKHDHNDVPKLDDFDRRLQFGIDNMDEPFFEFEMRNNGNGDNNNNKHFHNSRMLNDALPSKTQNRNAKQPDAQQKYDNNYGGAEDAMKMYLTSKADHHRHHHHHQSQGHPIDLQPTSKCQKSSNHIFDDEDVELADFQFDFDHQQQLVRKENSKNDDKNENRHGKNIDTGFPSDPFIDFDSFADVFDDDAKISKQPTPQFVYKRFKERTYAELMGSTPAWHEMDNDLHKRDAVRGGKADDFLFKQPATAAATALVSDKQNAIEKFDWHNERGSRGHRDHYEQHVKKRLSNQQYVISHAVEKFVPKSSNTNNEFRVLKTGHRHTATTSTQPNTFYIKCNNLVIKHD